MAWQDTIIAAHTAVTKQVSHWERLKSTRYFVWQEDGVNSLPADNRCALDSVTGSTDLFTRLERDPWAAALGESFSDYGISWRLRDVQYEPDTGLTHYTWDWEVPCGED